MSDRDDHNDDFLDDALLDEDALAAELLELRAIGRRVGSDPVVWEAPPADLWGRIAAEAEAEASDQPALALDPEPTVTPPADTEATAPADVVPLPRRSQTPWFLAAAAVIVVVAGIFAVNSWSSEESTEVLVASSQLDALDLAPEGAGGAAELVDHGDRMTLRLDLEGLVEDDGFLEVWIIDTEVSQLISLGPVRADNVYELPTGVDPQAFPIVDVSIEPLDGDPTHSGQSLLRGQLAF